MLGFILTFSIFLEIKSGKNPQYILKLFSNDYNIISELDEWSFLTESEKNRQNEIHKKEIENFTNCLGNIQKDIFSIISNDKISYLLLSFILDTYYHVATEKNIFYPGNRSQINELLITMKNFPEEISNIIDIISKYTRSYDYDNLALFILPDASFYTKDPDIITTREILGNVSEKSFSNILSAYYHCQKFRGLFNLIEVVKSYAKKKYFLEFPHILDIIVKVIHKKIFINNLYGEGSMFFNEIAELFEYQYIDSSIYEKLLDFPDYVHQNLIDCGREILIKELSRLEEEFLRVLRQDNLSKSSFDFFTLEIKRISEIRKTIGLTLNRVETLRVIRKNVACKIIRNAWFEHIKRICHPDHPKMQARFKEWYSE